MGRRQEAQKKDTVIGRIFISLPNLAVNSDQSMTMKQLEIMLLVHVIGCTWGAPLNGRSETTRRPFVPILNQFYDIRPDGTITFGYESGDGSFRYETRDPTGEVQGKFGYIDSNGHLRVVEYISGSTGYRTRWENISAPVIYNVHQTTTTNTAMPATTEQQLFMLPVADDADNAISDDHLPGPVLNGVDHSPMDQTQVETAQLSAGPQIVNDDEKPGETAPKPVDCSQGDSVKGNGTAPHANVQAVNGSAIEPLNGSDMAPQSSSDPTASITQHMPVNGTEPSSILHLQDAAVSNEMSTTVSDAPAVGSAEASSSQQGEGSTVNGTGWPDVLYPNGTLTFSGNITNLSFSMVLTEPPEIVDPQEGSQATESANIFHATEQQAPADEPEDASLSSWLVDPNGGTDSIAAVVEEVAIDIPPVSGWVESTGGTNSTPQNSDQTGNQETILAGPSLTTAGMNQTLTLHNCVSLLLNHLANKPLVKRIVKLFG